MSATLSLGWFARHEMTLAWRDWISMMSGGRSTRDRLVSGIALVFVGLLHLLAYSVVAPMLKSGVTISKETLVVLSAALLLTFSMMLSQAIEQVTRSFYARADLDLILSSPAPAQRLFAIRISAIAVTGALLTSLLASPFINIAAVIDSGHWLWAYALIAAMSALATGAAVIAALAMFATLGPKKTRSVAQIFAAVIGAAFLIGIQVAAVLTYGNLSRLQVLRSQSVINAVPDQGSLIWLPAKALLGDVTASVALVIAAFACLGVIISIYANRFSANAIAAAGMPDFEDAAPSGRKKAFVAGSTMQALRAKEWNLLRRDPWLMSQTLMQVLYLIPPALLLWRDMGAESQVHVILAPVLVMAFGQLAGGLAWLAISGEDAPDLVATAPITPRALQRAKNEAVLCVVAAGALPFLLALAIVSPWGALATMTGIVCASVSAMLIQIWFRVAARRSQFRRRQTASRASTFAEAFSSIFWAGATGFAVGRSWFAVLMAALALITLAVAYAIRPRL